MKKVLIIQQVAHEGPGRIGEVIESSGIVPEFVMAFEGQRIPKTLDGDTALIVLGGPMGVGDDDRYPFLKDEISLIESALKIGAPVLGICLGSQLLAAAAGARVYSGAVKEIGWYPLYINSEGKADRILEGLPSEIEVFQWHGDTFDVPGGAVNLASSELFPNQLIRVGEHAYGLQFHLEVTAEMISEWLSVNAQELEGVKGVIDPGEIRAKTSTVMTELERMGQSVFLKFCDFEKQL
ncbi:Glutamine amidotransferase, class I [hydrothermal vent metagenome]|uniref:Glutamine amidotransferase, class I n=1 Tax=hydrothermal vent metagenome TaxID=652676 RepID=A0A3B0QTD1_9ZZZZ